MANTKDIEDFERLLQNRNSKKSLILYNKVPRTNEQSYKPQDVIEMVYSQIKAIHLSDCAKSVKSNKNLKEANTSHLLPVNKLPVYASMQEVSKRNPNKFETQCVSDTQLINLIENAEAMDTHAGMTQEFDTTFTNIEDRNCENAKLKIDMKNEETTVPQDAANDDSSPRKKVINVVKENQNEIRSISDSDHNIAIQMIDHSTPDVNPQSPHTDTEDTVTFIQNLPNTQEVNNEVNDIFNSKELEMNLGQDAQRSPSPLLNMKARKRISRTPSPLVVSLESFENFENMAIPLIEDNTDFETAKHLINSQILGRELCLNTNTDDIFSTERNYSPILDFKSDELQIQSQDLRASPFKQSQDNIVLLQDIKEDSEKHSNSLKDEILFSSDEENDYVQKEMQDLPLTCALETSFYEQTGILEKTLYVGFQTASNKSIQICRDSLEKAQSILDNKDKTVEEFSLSELVEKCDPAASKQEWRTHSSAKTVLDNDTAKTITESRSDPAKNEHNLKEANDTAKTICDHNKQIPPDKQSFNGFITASNKKIQMSDKALERCYNVFKDIDLNQNFDFVKESETSHVAGAIKTSLNDNESIAHNVKNIEENNADDKINDELLLREFENTEMSLEKKNANKDTAFKGFKTANNKHIKLSKEALYKTKNIFQDIDVDMDEQKNTVDDVVQCLVKEVPSNFINTSIALEQEIDLNSSTQAFTKTKNLCQDTESNNKIETIENINQPSTSKAVFVGFKTAINKDIEISDEALSRTKNVFKDIGKDKSKIKAIEDIKPISMSKTEFLGFKTANNKDIKISDEALSKTENLFKNIDKEVPQTKTIKDFAQPSRSKPEFVGFKTATNKNIKISDHALSKSKHIFKDIDKEISTKSEIDDSSQDFKIASNKSESEQAMIGCSKLFQNLDPNDIIDIPKKIPQAQSINSKMGFNGFKTANNKPVNVSAEALLRSNKVFSDLDDFDANKLPYDENNKYQTTVFKGFQTASKKIVTISKDALAKSKSIFQGIEGVNKNISNVQSKSLQTANKTPVGVNKEAVIASKKMLDNFYDNQIEYSGSCHVGFKTASNKDVNISDEALAKCKMIFDGIEDMAVITAISPPKSEQNVKAFKGFQTANNREVKISNDALLKTKTILNDIDNKFTKIDTGVCFGGLQIANNEKVTVSEDALAKSTVLFHNIEPEGVSGIDSKDKIHYDDVTEKVDVKNFKQGMLGFQTANNKQIKISEDALKKSKMLLADSEKTISDNDKCSTLHTKRDDLKDPKQDVIDIDSILNTQVVNNFDENLCTEDFKDTAGSNKRSSSPILPCPRAKKRKFETPYKLNPKIKIDFNKDVLEAKKPENILTFKEGYKKNKKFTLDQLANLEKGKTTNLDPYILNFNLENILKFEFDKDRNDLKEQKMTVGEIKHLFAEVTDKKLIPEGWMDIQLKLILWKLMSYEIKFSNALGKVCTVRNIIDQLKYRYDKELYNAERPILRKILEKDDVSTKTMVLCVAEILVDGVRVTRAANLTNIELLLTDGWYFVKATIDSMLSKLVHDGKIGVGCKIVTCGAELMNCEQGVAPWEDTSAVRLHISGNSTRLARWDAKLGLRPGAILSCLPSVRAGGGKVSWLRAKVTRVYPRLYVEKFHDGSTVTRSERLEHQYQMKYEAERELMIEKIYEEVEKEFSDQDSQDSEDASDPSSKRKYYDSGSQIAKLMKTSKDPMEFRAQLTSTQVQELQEHVSKQRDKYLQAIQDKVQERLRPRNVVTLARGRIADVKRDGETIAVTKGMLSIWKPNDEVLDIFKEDTWIEVTNVVPTAFRNSEIQLSAGRQSVFRPVKRKEEDIFKPYLESLKRTCFLIKDLSQNPSMTTDYNEIDTVGVIFSIDPPNREFESNKNQFQNLYLADIDKNIICVNFWGGIKKFGYENVLDTGQVIYCGNLQKRAGNTRKNIPQYRATEFTLFTKTPKNESARVLVEELNKKLFELDRRKFCEDCTAVKQNYSLIKYLNDGENVSPYRFNKSDYNLDRNKIYIETPLGLKGANGKKDEYNLTGLDFESTFKQQDTQLSPKTLLRKKKVNEKISKLKMYGEPPPLSPINIINKSKNAAKSYKSPLLSNNDATPKKIPSITSSKNSENVATPKKLPDECEKSDSVDLVRSPIISMNRTYVKRSSVNPVKLNFSENAALDVDIDSNFDHFAEEFDGSPPLSLE